MNEFFLIGELLLQLIERQLERATPNGCKRESFLCKMPPRIFLRLHVVPTARTFTVFV